MNSHLIWLWFWFFVGMGTYWLKRAYYLVTGPNPIANSYTQFVERCWVPLFVRAISDSVLFWACFTPTLLTQGLAYLGWSSFSGVVGLITQFAPVAFLAGTFFDSAADFIISKVPILNNWLPQMPGPIPSVLPTDKQIEAQQVSK